ncbi:CU044_5270 family protein [Streptomyces montanisoli]|uniref:CU044_5270 family protein n=1 Tax=Streptomyces montanisoli TaxID=2798581 RepID=A0A940M4E7_9ACTN|nr:CU044_5270 family protein [Streptomyces montanisoli]MBP0455909.1 CU044_5270 family protein [Streptomyces montanisoli]
MSTYDVEETGMSEQQALMDFPGAEALRAAGRVEAPSADALARAMAAVEGAARREVREGVVVAPLRKRRRLLSVIALAAVAAGVAVAGVNLRAGDQHGTARAQSASVFLNNVAEVAATQPAGSGRYWKTRTDSMGAYISRSMDVTYTSASGKPFRKSHFPGWRLGSRTYDWNGLDALTTDPDQLLRRIENTTKASADEDEDAATLGFVQASTLLANAPAGPRLRSGVFKALADLRGVSVVGTVKDSIGRSGTELSFHGGVGTTEVIIDPRTSKLLELIEPWRSEKDQRRATYLSTGLTDSIG